MKVLEYKEEILFKVRTNKIVRTLLYPYMNYKRKRGKVEFSKTSDATYLKSLKGSHKAERCFIIGNGPSLTVDDLEKIGYECKEIKEDNRIISEGQEACFAIEKREIERAKLMMKNK